MSTLKTNGALPFALPTPKETESLPMLTNQVFRLCNDQGILPGKKSGKDHQSKTSTIIGMSSLYLPFRIQGKLFPEKEILSP